MSSGPHGAPGASGPAFVPRRLHARCFDADVVLVPPGFNARLAGRAAVIDTYREFLDNATVHEFELLEPTVDVFATTAVGTCPWTTEYSVNGRRWKANGHDVFALRETDGQWRGIDRYA